MLRLPNPTLALGLLVALSQPLAGGAQQEPPPLFVERLEVNVVNVEVWVTDGDGNRVLGLTRDDFEITQDGEPVEISNFYAGVREDFLLRGLDEPEAAPVPPAASLPADKILHLAVLVDSFNTRVTNRNRVLAELESFLEDRVVMGDRVMLMAYDRAVSVVEPFTRDRQKILRGLREMTRASSPRTMLDAERRRRVRAMNQAAVAGELETAYQYVRSQVQEETNGLRRTAQAIADVVRSLAGLPGRKAILYVSDGLPKRPGEDLYQQLADLFGFSSFETVAGAGAFIDPYSESVFEDETRLFNRIAREANAHQVTFYTLSAQGPGSQALSPAEAEQAVGGSGHVGLDAIRSMSRQETLLEIADSTGGTSILNTFNFDRTLTRMAADFDNFYSLGFQTGEQEGEGFREIEVRVKQPGLRVRHRRGFYDKPQSERVADRTLSSLILGMEKNPLGVRVDFGKPEKRGRGRFHLPVMVQVPLRNVTLLPGAGGEQGRLRIYLVVQDEEGDLSQVSEYVYPLSVPEDQLAAARSQSVAYAATLAIGRGLPTVAVGVWDEISGSDSFVHKQVRVGGR